MIVNDARPGLDTRDATAAASDVAAGETFYASGEKKTGTLPETLSGRTVSLPTVTLVAGDATEVLVAQAFEQDRIMRTGAKAEISVMPAAFGSATAADVLKGKSFTSAAGVRVAGALDTTFALAKVGAVASTVADVGSIPSENFSEEVTVPITGFTPEHQTTYIIIAENGGFFGIGHRSNIEKLKCIFYNRSGSPGTPSLSGVDVYKIAGGTT